MAVATGLRRVRWTAPLVFGLVPSAAETYAAHLYPERDDPLPPAPGSHTRLPPISASVTAVFDRIFDVSEVLDFRVKSRLRQVPDDKAAERIDDHRWVRRVFKGTS